MLKEVVECGLVEDVNVIVVGDFEFLFELNILVDYESDVDLEQEFEKNLKGNLKCFKKRSKGKVFVVKKVKVVLVEFNSDFVEFLQES